MVRRRVLMLSGLFVLLAAPGRTMNGAVALDDATILAIFDQANTADILTGRLGAKYGASEDVRGLARMVVTDHVAAQQLGRDLARKLGLMPTPPDNDTSVADCARAVALLQSKTGPEFDRAYLKYEVAFHQSAVDAVKGTLLPAATHPELRDFLKTVLPGFERHLAATRAMAWKMGLQ